MESLRLIRPKRRPDGRGRLLGLDYGSKTVGVAVSDPLFLTSQPVETIVRERENKLRRTLSRIEELVTSYGVETIVLGLPRNMDGTEGERCEKTRAFAEQLQKRTSLPVVFADERLTTAEAAEILTESGVAAKDQKKHIDAVAAALILEDYMHSEETRNREQEWVTVTDPETGKADRLLVVEKTVVGGRTYLLLAENDKEESDAWIFSTDDWDADEPSFTPVEDDEEIKAVARIFEELLEDTQLL